MNHSDPSFPPDAPIPAEARPTLTPEEANAALSREALTRFSEAVESFTKLLGGLATKEQLAELAGKVDALDAGMRMLSAGQDEIARNVLDVKAALEGEGGLAQKIDGVNELGKSAYDVAEDALNVAMGTWMQVTVGKLDDQRRQGIESIVVSRHSGRRR